MPLPPPPPTPSSYSEGGGAELFGKCLYKGDAGQIMIFKSIKNSEYESKKKKNTPIVVSTIFHFCFHGIYSLVPTNIFFVKEYFFSYLVARGWGNFKFLGELLYWGHLVSFLGEGEVDHFLP